MKIHVKLHPGGLRTTVCAERTVGRVVYRGEVETVSRSGSLREAVVDAVNSLHERHGKRLPFRIGQVKTGGEN